MKERSFPRIISDIAKTNGYSIHTYGDGWLFELTKGDKRVLLHGYKFPINNASASTLADDKATMSELLEESRIEVIPHFYIDCSGNSWKREEGRVYSLFERYSALAVKPNNGTGGQNVMFAYSKEELKTCMDKLASMYEMVAISPYVDAEGEYRVILFDGNVEISFEKVRKSVIGDGLSTIGRLANGSYTDIDISYIPSKGERILLTKKHNLALGATPEDIVCEDRDEIFELASKAIAVSGLRFASVDILRVKGKLYVLEINSGVMTEQYAFKNQENYNRARDMYSKVLAECFKQQ